MVLMLYQICGNIGKHKVRIMTFKSGNNELRKLDDWKSKYFLNNLPLVIIYKPYKKIMISILFYMDPEDLFQVVYAINIEFLQRLIFFASPITAELAWLIFSRYKKFKHL